MKSHTHAKKEFIEEDLSIFVSLFVEFSSSFRTSFVENWIVIVKRKARIIVKHRIKLMNLIVWERFIWWLQFVKRRFWFGLAEALLNVSDKRCVGGINPFRREFFCVVDEIWEFVSIETPWRYCEDFIDDRSILSSLDVFWITNGKI